MKMNPRKHTAGATLMRRALKMSGLNADSVDPGPLISRNPRMMTTIPIPNKVKLVLSKAKLFLSIYFDFN